MASGKINLSKPSGSSMVGYISWSSSSNGSVANTSTVTATLYMKKDSSVSTLGTFAGTLKIDGTSTSISKYGTWTNSYVKVGSASKTVAHNSNGSKSITISTSVSNSGTTQAGTYSASKTVALDTIPRASSITSSASWIAGNNLSVTVSRHSTAFTHTVTVAVDGVTVASSSGVSTSVTFSSKAFHTKVFKALAQSASKTAKITVTTYSGSAVIGSAATATGTVSAPAASTMKFDSDTAVGAIQNLQVSRGSALLCHKLKYVFGGTEGYILGSSSSAVTTASKSWTVPTGFYQLMKNTQQDTCELILTSYYSGASDSGAEELVQVRTPVSGNFTVKVTGSEPEFNGFTLIDRNAVTNGLTKSHNIMIEGYSTATAVIEPQNKALAKNYAEMSSYLLEAGGQSKEASYSDTDTVQLSLEKIKGDTISVSAYDSRGSYTKVSRTVSLKPYVPVSIANIKLERINGVDTRTLLTMDVYMWKDNFCDTVENRFTECKYTYREAGSDKWDSVYKTIQLDKLVYDEENKLYHLSEEIIGDHQDGFALSGSYDVKVTVSDLLDSSEAVASINSGYPGIYLKRLDDNSNACYQVGVNCVPDEALGNGLHVAGSSITLNGREVTGAPVGSVMGWCTDTAPEDWLLLDGRAVSRTAYPALFAVLGSTYGAGDGSSTFNLPDMRGRVAVGKSTASEFSTLGKKGGAATHTLTTSELPAHTHGSAGAHTHTIPNTANGINGSAVRAESFANASDSGRNLKTGSAGAHTHTSVGGGSAHNNLQPYMVLNYIIKAK